jgi:hypothetical protein
MTDLKRQCAAEIKKLIPNITGSDKNEALSACKISRPTLDKYLKGAVTDIDKALEIIQFFKGKTQTRISQLKGAA